MAFFSYSTLEKKYKGFNVPQFLIEVNGREVKLKDYPVTELNVLMSAAYDMSSCEFVIGGIFDPKSGKFENDVYSAFKPGSIVKVKVGYGSSLQGVFTGYINSLSFEFDGQRGPVITVQCLDAKGALVNNKTWKSYGKQDLKSIITKILNEKCSKYAKIEKIEYGYDSNEKGALAESPEIKDNVDDYTYLKILAEKTNNSFCVIDDKLYFCKNLAISSTVKTKLTWGKNLLSFASEIDLSGQIGAVEVYSTNPIMQEAFMAKATTISVPGESGAAVASVAKNKPVVVTDPEVFNQDQANQIAQHMLEHYAARFVSCKGSVIGLPDLKAGDKIEVDGMGKGVDGIYFLHHVNHRIDSNGYITCFEGSSPTVR